MWDISRAMGAHSAHYCDLETIEDEYTIASGDGSLMTLIRVRGLLQIPGKGEYNKIIDLLTTTLKTAFSKPGHHLQISARYDPEGNGVGEGMQPLFDTARRLGVEEAGMGVLKDWKQSLAKYISNEDVLIALWSTPRLLPGAVARTAGHRQKKRVQRSTAWTKTDGMQMAAGMREIAHTHQAVSNSIVDALSAGGVMAERLSIGEATQKIRGSLFPISGEWAPVTGVKKYPSGAGENRYLNETSIGAWAAPSLAEQMVAGGARYHGLSMVEVGGKLYAPVDVKLAPQEPEPFNNLFRRLMNKRMPYALSIRIDSGGEYWWAAVKRGVTAILRLTSPDSKRISAAYAGMGEYAKSGARVGLQITATTWVDNDDSPETTQEILRRQRELIEVIQGWGSSDAHETYGDPLFTLFSTMPGWTGQCPAPIALAPLPDALVMVPFFRPTMPWKQGTLMWRTPDGRAMPYAQGSTRQTSWVDLGIAPMGYGKSVTLSTINLAFCLAAGLNDLGLLSVTDIGPSSRGVVRVLQALLPKDRFHWAVYHRLRMVPEHSVNVFDTPLGCRKPLPNHRFYLRNLLTLLATPIGESRPYDGVSGIASACIDAAYDAYADGAGAKPYVRSICQDVDAVVDGLNLLVDQHATWWEIVDQLFDAGYQHEAGMAQRYAVPTLGEVAGFARNDKVTGTYGQAINGQKVTEIFWQSLMDAIRAYPIMKEPTRLDLSDARVIALDIEEVAPRGTEDANRQTAVMFMLSRHITASRFFEMPDDVILMPEKYREYHQARIERMREVPKRLSWDEFHRASQNQAVADQVVGDVETSIRESRKWNLHIGLYSQNIGDFPPVLLSLATSISVLGAGTEKDVGIIGEELGLTEGAVQAIRSLRKPGRSGASFLAYYRTSDGVITHKLMNTLGPQLLWAFSTTTEDVAVRDKLANAVGYLPALALLARNYPGGVKRRIEVLNELAESRGVDMETYSPVNEVVDELANSAQARRYAA
ncbi:hypothetical protein [Thiolapillus sp.]|uniref:hypothetical protein n=5 Tax=Thiolapillus sp. TaxID=2017437 RepID=UPI0025D17417|nr:hypothetical protein [Thiolapillus sp.]